MEFPIKLDTVKSGWSIVNIEGSQVMIFKKKKHILKENWYFQLKLSVLWEFNIMAMEKSDKGLNLF